MPGRRMKTWVSLFLCAGFVSFVLLALVGFAQQESGTRSVEGVVTDPRGRPVDGAVVKLKNLKNLQIRSFLTNEDGFYRFHGLSKNTDYELVAEYGDMRSRRRVVSVFDTRDKVIINLQLKPARKDKEKQEKRK